VLGSSIAVHYVQPIGNATIAKPFREGSDRAVAVTCTTKISGLQLASVLDGNEVIVACRASGGTGHIMDDSEVWAAQARLAREEGIFCEPAAAVALAAALTAAKLGEVKNTSPLVCIVTGSGFKDTASVARMTATASCPVVDLEKYIAFCSGAV